MPFRHEEARNISVSRFPCTALGAAGIAFMFNAAAFDWPDHPALIGNCCLLLAPALWAAHHSVPFLGIRNCSSKIASDNNFFEFAFGTRDWPP